MLEMQKIAHTWILLPVTLLASSPKYCTTVSRGITYAILDLTHDWTLLLAELHRDPQGGWTLC